MVEPLNEHNAKEVYAAKRPASIEAVRPKRQYRRKPTVTPERLQQQNVQMTPTNQVTQLNQAIQPNPEIQHYNVNTAVKLILL